MATDPLNLDRRRTLLRLSLGLSALALPACRPFPPPPRAAAREVPSRRALVSARELSEILPDWTLTGDKQMSLDTAGLKEAALLWLNGYQRDLVIAYSRAYCDLPFVADHCAVSSVNNGTPDPRWPEANFRKASGMYLLLRVVFALPMRYPAGTAQKFSGFVTPRDNPPEKDAVPPTEPYLSWPVREDPDAHVLWIERCLGYRGTTYASVYHATDEYDYVSFAHFPRRTRAQIEALEIKLVDDVPPVPRREVAPARQ